MLGLSPRGLPSTGRSAFLTPVRSRAGPAWDAGMGGAPGVEREGAPLALPAPGWKQCGDRLGPGFRPPVSTSPM